MSKARAIFGVIFICVGGPLLMLFLFLGRFLPVDYFNTRDTQQYLTFSAIVEEVSVTNGDYFRLDLQHSQEGFHKEFRIPDENGSVVADLGLTAALTEGKEIIITASSYYPAEIFEHEIVAIEVDGVCYLDFETGYANSVGRLREGFAFVGRWVLISAGVVLAGVAMINWDKIKMELSVIWIKLKKKRENKKIPGT